MTHSIFWFRRDLRLKDNAGLYHALKAGRSVLPIFIFDSEILDKLEDKKDARVHFLHESLEKLKAELETMGSSLLVLHGKPIDIWATLTKTYTIDAVYTNRDFETYAIERDTVIAKTLGEKGITFHTYKDHIIFEKDEVLKADGTPYTVFTPYSRRWKEKLTSRGESMQTSYFFKSYPTESYFSAFHKTAAFEMPNLAALGFSPNTLLFPKTTVEQSIIKSYDKTRDYPAILGTSRLGLHFRFGTISIREKARKAEALNDTYLNELIWRDFYSQILANFPHVEKNAFRAQYDNIEWRNNAQEYEAWCSGQTGYPLVDAGMRELNTTGYMHNRVRMVVASFLCKHLLIDWRWGEAYFAQKLLDFDLASNNGGWQWAAGCGTDAAPYFRIFNPESQLKKFDKKLKYTLKWVPEYGTIAYAQPIVEHKFARERCLATYKSALKG